MLRNGTSISIALNLCGSTYGVRGGDRGSRRARFGGSSSYADTPGMNEAA